MTTTPRKVLVAGASGGIGQAFCEQLAAQFPDIQLIRLARNTAALPVLNIPTQDLRFDLTDEANIISALQALPDKAELDWVFIATGWLHDDTLQPEKTWRSLDADHLLRSYALNAVGPRCWSNTCWQSLTPNTRPPLAFYPLASAALATTGSAAGIPTVPAKPR
ncbi:NAD-dependent epimerase/dehydratase family protein [Thiothrix subterranea]|uniref:NAD-dependent epimerase/dehydratase family protein n=1 Tax=Thiothrix subterranea TaxID=2735563 RepID=UPI00280BC591|nr:NAD-dependent epimerase/dehydratase family protein [Thiothrix subterranea]